MTSAMPGHRRGGAATDHEVVATKTAIKLDLQALHRVRERWSASARHYNQIRAFLLERGIAGGKDNGSCAPSCRASWPSTRCPVASHGPHIEDLACDCAAR